MHLTSVLSNDIMKKHCGKNRVLDRSLKTEHRQAINKTQSELKKIVNDKQKHKFRESLILAQDERWRRA